jgi:peptide/nickel transport system permease protein
MTLALRKTGRAIFSVWLLVTIIFVLMRMAGDPAMELLGPDETSKEVLESFRSMWGIDRPIWEQYFNYVGHVMQGDFGRSFVEYRPAFDIVVERLPKTLLLMSSSLGVALLIGIPFGIIGALHHNRPMDTVVTTTSMALHATPHFILGIALILIFVVWLRLLPVGGSGTWQQLLMPTFTFGASGAAIFSRFIRSAMLETMRQPYVTAAQARGIPWSRIVLFHVVPNAALPVLTIAGLMLGSMVGGSIVVETMFAWPGVGRLTVTSVGLRDLAVIQVIVFFVMGAMVTTNLAVDFLYTIVDPRIRIRSGTER